MTRLNKQDGTIDGFALGYVDTGVWDIDGDTVCHHFKIWRNGMRECLTLYKNDNSYDSYTLDGKYFANFELHTNEQVPLWVVSGHIKFVIL